MKQLDAVDVYQRTLLVRLERLLRLQNEYAQDISPLGQRLLDHCAGSTYVDLCESGAVVQAERILLAARHP